MTTKKDLHALAEAINKARNHYGLSGNYVVRYAYGRPRLEKNERADETGGSAYISPRLTPAQLADWMTAYLAGMAASTNETVGY